MDMTEYIRKKRESMRLDNPEFLCEAISEMPDRALAGIGKAIMEDDPDSDLIIAILIRSHSKAYLAKCKKEWGFDD